MGPHPHYRCGPWRQIVSVHETLMYQVILLLSCGHRVTRIKRTHRVYVKARCELCLEQVPQRSLPPPVVTVRVKPIIRPEVHERFLAVLKRADARARLDRRIVRGNADRFVKDDSGLRESPLLLPPRITVEAEA